LLDGGIGAGQSTFQQQIYDNVYIEVSGGTGNSIGFTDAGSGFKPQILNSTVVVSGSDGKGISTNNGRVVVRYSRIKASSIGVNAVSGSFFGGSFTFDNSILDAPTGFRVQTSGGTQQIRMGNSQLDAATNIDLVSGSVDAVCINTHDESYLAIGATCT
jgi:hypothetical protein